MLIGALSACDGPAGATPVPGASGVPELGADANPGPLHYVALGDSFSSGEGAPYVSPEDMSRFTAENPDLNRPSISPEDLADRAAQQYGWLGDTGTHSGGFGNGCHRSSHAYPVRVWGALDQRDSDWGVSFRACSGARTAAMGTGFKGEPAQFDAFVTGGPADLITVGIGGNDLGFSDLVTSCMIEGLQRRATPLPYRGLVPQCRREWSATIEQRIPGLRAQLSYLFWDLKDPSRLKDGGKIAATLFPRPFPQDPDGTCSLGLANDVDEPTMRWVNDNVATTLNTVIIEEARKAGISVIDTSGYLSTTFGRHDLCVDDGAQRWINRAIPSDKNQSIHPKFGYHEKVAEAVLACWDSDTVCPPVRTATLPTEWARSMGCDFFVLPYDRYGTGLSTAQLLDRIVTVEQPLSAGARDRAEKLRAAPPPPIESGTEYSARTAAALDVLAGESESLVAVAQIAQREIRSTGVLSPAAAQSVRDAELPSFDELDRILSEFPEIAVAARRNCQ
ncbi:MULTISPECIES: GDSL-type esterase/lipase family protein [unclassified Pseudonocardia]|uniref:GDSL-type esterase/lipase family protein n=1 Tax=unclassified Pseudonocardia TaxID=2619320 RepID=UPI0001FFDB42|nr:GDSL-type esterase/lipase family protein [Pseudonocardia sp. Ae707_Ps1]